MSPKRYDEEFKRNAVGAFSNLMMDPSRSQSRGTAYNSRSVSVLPSSSVSQSCTSRCRSVHKKKALHAK